MTYKLALLITAVFALGGCVTATRGANSTFTIITTPPGAKVLTSVETRESRKQYDWRARKAASQTGELPNFEYYSCKPTPCSMNIPRRREFSMLIVKDGYEPMVAAPKRMHNKKAAELAKIQTGLSATSAITATTGVAAIGSATISSSAIISSGAAVGAVAILAAVPTLLVASSALEVDQRTGAKYDFVPNPMSVTLISTDNELRLTKAYKAFDLLRHSKSLDPVETDMCYIGNKRMTCFEMKKIQKRRAKANEK